MSAFADALGALLRYYESSPEIIGDKLGIPGRQIRRWLEGSGRRPALANVRLWPRLLETNSVSSASLQTAAVHSMNTVRRPGLFNTEDISSRLKHATQIWALRSRLEFRANYSSTLKTLFLERLLDPLDPFELNCVWVAPALFPDRVHSNQIKPAWTPKATFRSIATSLRSQARENDITLARLEKCVRGLEISSTTAAEYGFANSPFGNLVLVYPNDTQFGTHVDLFVEMPFAWYSDSRQLVDTVEEFVWAQIHTPIAMGCFDHLWPFAELPGKAQVVFTPQSIADWKEPTTSDSVQKTAAASADAEKISGVKQT